LVLHSRDFLKASSCRDALRPEFLATSGSGHASSIAERKLCRCQLTEDSNVEITGRGLREGSNAATRSAPVGDDDQLLPCGALMAQRTIKT
jgi:hypothetical protein